MNSYQPHVKAVCVSEGGIPRKIVPKITITKTGISEDRHRFVEHEVANRAISLFDFELYEQLIGNKHPCLPGSVGENISLIGVFLHKLPIGSLLKLGEVEIKIERAWVPCYAKNASNKKVTANRSQVAGCFASVIFPGVLKAGDPVKILTSSD